MEETRVGRGVTPRKPEGLPRVGDRLGDFLLVDELGAGSFAKVYLAHQSSLKRTVALKVYAEDSDEARTLAQLDHPHIVRVYDQRSVPGTSVRLLYMEYMPGGTLEAVVERVLCTPPAERTGQVLLDCVDAALAARGQEPPVDSMLRARLARATWPEAVCIVGAQLATALDHAHASSVLHRDVKPGNVLLAPSGRAKLADFNVSFTADLEGTHALDFLGGSIAYMAPEQLKAIRSKEEADAEALDGRADLYALGVLLWELLCGERPFDDPPEGASVDTLLEDLHRTRSSALDASLRSNLPDEVPALLVDTLRACLAPDRDDRPATGAALARRLELCLDPRAVKLLTPAPRGWTAWARRYPLATLLGVGLLVNAFLSVFNILYNLNVAVGEEHLEQFHQQVGIVNTVAFTIGIAIMVRLVWPIAAAVRRRERGLPVDETFRARARRRAIGLGDAIALVVLPLWLLGGLSFPIWRKVSGLELTTGDFVQFTLSNALFGVLGTTACFFLLTFVSARALVPRLIVPGEVDEGAAASMRKVARRRMVYFTACTAVPFLSVMLLAWIEADMRMAFLWLGAIGATGFGASLWMQGEIRRDLDALARVVD